MSSIKNTQTEKNLLKAFAGESQARNRYTYYAGQARKEGLMKVAAQFEETANQEKEHAKRFFSFLEGGMVEISASFPAGKILSTMDNLKAAAHGENEEYTDLYPLFAKTARDEGFEAVAKLFESIAVAEKQHEHQFLVLLDLIQKGQMFKRVTETKWRCLNCGFTHEGLEAPIACPACAHPQAFFETIK